MMTIPDETLLANAKKLLEKYNLCDSCIGRLFARLYPKKDRKQIGKEIREKISLKKTSEEKCWLCEGICKDFDYLADLAIEKIREYEFETFLVGSIVDDEILEKEKLLQDLMEAKFSESIKLEINREVAERIGKRFGRKISIKNPDVTIVVDTRFYHVSFQVRSVYIYGRYLKFVRGIPQTKWPCRVCRGRGCRRCGYTGKMYETSVEELIAKKALEIFDATDEAFHGSGREDIDALMLGDGRPFVLEIKNPKKRNVDLKMLEKRINNFAKGKVEVRGLAYVDKNKIVELKKAKHLKTYKVSIIADEPLDEEKLKEATQLLQGKIIKQATPLRVLHRRADLERERKIIECKVEAIEDNKATLIITAEAGTYIKELISGDQGRTKPSLSEILNTNCRVKQLDVIEIKGE
ncbi:MAG TPA: tRNA pseudouridine(54/55) synthase Pus10 [Thermoplasmatales archaeon]|nr:tRNA pseudouridine(54/55) synthase Pus10 [Thermoplasmatales archaeon]HEX08651.1 tRNA pseudouridine(54/55) synthase Pus10 [Thermoplasmatales archaeon]